MSCDMGNDECDCCDVWYNVVVHVPFLLTMRYISKYRVRNSSVGSALSSQSCVMQPCGFDPPLSFW